VLTLQDLLDRRELGLAVDVSDAAALARPVAGAYVAEAAEPADQVPSGWVVLTTGLCLGDVRAQRRFVADAHRAGLAAIGVALGPVFGALPEAMRAEARRHGIPLFSVPAAGLFREIVSFVTHAQLSRELYVLERTLSTQAYLMSAMTEAEPAHALATRLAESLSDAVYVFRPDGRVEIAVGDGPHQLIWSEIAVRSARLEEFVVADWSVVSTPVVVGERLHGWLAVASRGGARDQRARREIVRNAQRLLGVIFQANHAAATEERRMKAEILHLVLSGGELDWARLRQRAAAFGVDLSAPARALIVSLRAGEQAPTSAEVEARLTQLERLLAQAHVPALLARRDDQLIVLADMDGHDVAAWVRPLASPGVASLGGLGRPVTSLREAVRSVRDAELAVRKLTRVRAASGTVLAFEDLDLTEWLLADRQLADLQPRIQTVLGPLKQHPELHGTLVAYLAADLNIIATAQSLHLHPNSLRYRLGRIEKLLGRSLSSFPALVDLYLSMLSDLSPSDHSLSIAAAEPAADEPPEQLAADG
jgi:purine catabolism regulator